MAQGLVQIEISWSLLARYRDIDVHLKDVHLWSLLARTCLFPFGDIRTLHLFTSCCGEDPERYIRFGIIRREFKTELTPSVIVWAQECHHTSWILSLKIIILPVIMSQYSCRWWYFLKICIFVNIVFAHKLSTEIDLYGLFIYLLPFAFPRSNHFEFLAVSLRCTSISLNKILVVTITFWFRVMFNIQGLPNTEGEDLFLHSLPTPKQVIHFPFSSRFLSMELYHCFWLS